MRQNQTHSIREGREVAVRLDGSGGSWGSGGSAEVIAWRALGRIHRLRGYDVFTVDVGPDDVDGAAGTGGAGPSGASDANGSADARGVGGPPVLLIHGFPTSSFDWRHLVARLRSTRRVIALDLLGFGLSAKPDQPYRLAEQADLVQSLVVSLGIDEVDLVTHDMGDTVGGELLARDLDGELPFTVRRRVLVNGSIYIAMAALRSGQRLLLALPDRRLPVGLPRVLLDRGLTEVCSPACPPSRDELDAQWTLLRSGGGDRVMPRVVRYIRERQAREGRFTGAIERHPSPLTMIWGRDDTVALPAMAERLHAAAPGATLHLMQDTGHFPMLERPEAFNDLVEAALADGPRPAPRTIE